MSANEFPEFQILTPIDQAEVQGFSRLRADPSDPFIEWSAPWRSESLDHYLKLGWSVGLKNQQSGQLEGYVLCQPFLFMRGLTQTVWIEHVEAVTASKVEVLLETAIKIAREKHMQSVLIEESLIPASLSQTFVSKFKGQKVLAPKGFIDFPTTKRS